MPNVLGMFNQAKINTFTTEVQRLMDVAITTFTKDALQNSGKSVFYSSVDSDLLKTKKLAMSGNTKDYYPYEEERRLFYVALTRCKRKVYLFVPIKNPSIFIEELLKMNKKINIREK